MDNWHLSWYPPLISLSVLSCRLSGLVQGAPNRKVLRQLCLKKKGKLTGFCLREYPSTPSWFQHFSSPSREQLHSEGIQCSQLSASSTIPPSLFWTISFCHLSSSYFLTARVFLNLNFHFHFEVSCLIILSPPNCSHLLLPISTPSTPFPLHSICHIPGMLSFLSPTSCLYWEISRPRGPGLAPSATQAQIICKVSQCRPAF